MLYAHCGRWMTLQDRGEEVGEEPTEQPRQEGDETNGSVSAGPNPQQTHT